MQYVFKHKLYSKVLVSRCWRETGRLPITKGWAGTNKGTAAQPNVRSRCVAKEYNTYARPDLYVATSPWME